MKGILGFWKAIHNLVKATNKVEYTHVWAEDEESENKNKKEHRPMSELHAWK